MMLFDDSRFRRAQRFWVWCFRCSCDMEALNEHYSSREGSSGYEYNIFMGQDFKCPVCGSRVQLKTREGKGMV